MSRRRATSHRWILPILAGGLLALPPAAAEDDLPFLEYARIDPEKVMQAEACGECHAHEYEVWKGTPHATGFKTLHRRPRAEEIAGKLGFRLIKRESFCYSCHYTPEIDDDAIRVVSGVSCESCHGAARDWIDVHNNYGGAPDHRGESAAHRQSRIGRSRAAGMRRPSDLYPVVANCFGCHTVPNERLVNVGGHGTGSTTFEFVEWSQGEMRHNFLDSFRAGGEPVNAERPLERKRPMYVVGRALDLEYSLRGMAEATADGVYAKAMSRRVRSALAEARAIASSVKVPAVGEMVEVVRGVQIVPGNRAALLAAADKVGAATRRFLDGPAPNLAALDPLLLGTPPALEPDAEPGVAVAETGVAPRTDAGAGPAPTAAAAPSDPAAPGPRSASTAGTDLVEGAFKRRVHAPSPHKTLGPGACAGCHADQNRWWFGHAHFSAADPFFDGERRNLQIARLYGLSPAQMTRGDQVCMDCHGTIVAGKESRDVLDGVGCESCHGAAGDWLEPHKVEGGPSGAGRPGYVEALKRGKADLKQLSVRAEVCTGCHYVTEPRLLSAGHPSGAEFDYVRGMESVRHWQSAPAPSAQLASAFERALAARGPLPSVRVASAAALPAAPPAAGAGDVPLPGPRSPAATTPPAFRPELAAARVLRARPQLLPGASDAGAGAAALGLEPFPEIEPTAPVEEVLRLLQERLRSLYRSLGAGEDR